MGYPRTMGAGLAGSTTKIYGNANVNQIQYGDKLQGLPPVTGRRDPYRIYKTKAGGNAPDRFRVFCINQLGGIGMANKNSQFAPNADGIGWCPNHKNSRQGDIGISKVDRRNGAIRFQSRADIKVGFKSIGRDAKIYRDNKQDALPLVFGDAEVTDVQILDDNTTNPIDVSLVNYMTVNSSKSTECRPKEGGIYEPFYVAAVESENNGADECFGLVLNSVGSTGDVAIKWFPLERVLIKHNGRYRTPDELDKACKNWVAVTKFEWFDPPPDSCYWEGGKKCPEGRITPMIDCKESNDAVGNCGPDCDWGYSGNKDNQHAYCGCK